MHYYREEGFPVTIVRQLYLRRAQRSFGVQGSKGGYQNLKRMMEGKPVIIHGMAPRSGPSPTTRTLPSALPGSSATSTPLVKRCRSPDETLTWNQIYETIASTLGAELKAVHVSSEFLDACSDEDYRGNLLGGKRRRWS